MRSYMCSYIILMAEACHMFAVSRIVSGINVCWIYLAKLGLFCGERRNSLKAYKAPLRPRPQETRYLWKRRLLYESALWIRAYFRNRYPEWNFWILRVWWICVDDWNRILLKSLRHKPGSSLLNENFQVENGGQQCCRLSSPVLLHALKSILLF